MIHVEGRSDEKILVDSSPSTPVTPNKRGREKLENGEPVAKRTRMIVNETHLPAPLAMSDRVTGLAYQVGDQVLLWNGAAFICCHNKPLHTCIGCAFQVPANFSSTEARLKATRTSKHCRFELCMKQPGYGPPGGQKQYCAVHKASDMVLLKGRRCQNTSCNKQAVFGSELKKPLFCKAHKEPSHVNVAGQRCQHSGCTTKPVYGAAGDKPLFCALHKRTNDVDVQSRHCREPGCSKIASFGLEGGQKTFCVAHKSLESVNFNSSPMCQHLTCNKQASYGPVGGRLSFCSSHREIRNVRLRNRPCEHNGCMILPSFGPTGGKPVHCHTHKSHSDVQLTATQCTNTGCAKNAVYGPTGEKASVCREHTREGYTCIKSRRCDVDGCTTTPSFGKLFDKQTRCAKHKLAGMFVATRPKCPCGDRQPCWTDEPNNYPLRCEACKTEQDKNVVEQKCQTCGLMNLIREGLTNCSECQDYHTKKPHKAKETIVKAILDHAELPYKSHDTIPEASCHRYRPDFLFDWGTHIVILEVDESQHSSYACECEQARMINLFQDQGGMKTLFIRFNPDNYRDRSGKLHKWTPGRGGKLLDVIRQTRDHPPEHILSAVYLYYDNFDANAVEFVKLEYGL